MDKKTKVTRVTIVILIVLAALLSFYFLRAQTDENQQEFLGNVDVREVQLGFELQGRISSMAFEEGERVKQGDLMATLDTALLDDTIRAASAGVEAARADMSRVKNGNRPEEIAIAQAAYTRKKSGLNQAAKEYDRRRLLVESGAVSRAVFEESKQKFETATADLEAARQSLSLLQSGSRQEDIKASEAAAANARANLAQARTRLNKSQLVAPSDGVVTARVQEVGAIAGPGSIIYRLTIDRPVYIRAYANETQLGLLDPGTKVSVQVDGRDKPYSGTIGYVSPKAEFTPKTVQTTDMRTDLVYRFRVVVSNPDGGLRQGQPVSVQLKSKKADGKSKN